MEVHTFRHYNRETNDVKYAMPTALMKRPGYNTSGKAIQTQINSFPILKYPTITVYQYDVSHRLNSTHSLVHCAVFCLNTYWSTYSCFRLR